MNSEASKPRPPVSSQPNRRRAGRHRLSIPATVHPENATTPTFTVTITELSVGGLRAVSAHPLQIGTVYVVSSFDSLIVPNTRIRIITQQPAVIDVENLAVSSAEPNVPPSGKFDVGAEVL